jgi:hypothetical protein
MFLRVEISAIPADARVEHLFELRDVFRGRLRDLAFLTPAQSPLKQVLTLDHVVIGADVTAPTPDAELGRILVDFRRAVGARRATVTGLKSRDAVAMAVHAGFDEVSGPGLGDDLRHLPGHTTVRHRADLLRPT